VFARFTQRYPQVRLTLREGSPAQIAALLRDGVADVGIATESDEEFEELVTLPCAQWTRSVITPLRHPLLGAGPLTLEKIAQYPLIPTTLRSQQIHRSNAPSMQPTSNPMSYSPRWPQT
jgi:LysR family cys regulon transcriptional activator